MGQYEVSAVENLLRLVGIKTVLKTSEPDATDTGYNIPTLWINTSTQESYLLIQNDPTAVWVHIGQETFGKSFIDFYDADTAPPGSPTTGDAYILNGNTPVDSGWTALGATNYDWVQYDGSTWAVVTPQLGQIAYNETETDFYIYGGAPDYWELLTSSISGLTYVTDSRRPNTSDNSYVVPTLWVDTTGNTAYVLTDVTTGIATWLQLSNNQLGDAQNSVLSIAVSTDPPPTENTGDRYLLDSSGAPNAAWDGAAQEDIVQFDGATWVATTPNEGMFTEVEDENTVYIYTTSWVKMFAYTGASFTTDSGSAVPTSGGVLTIAGDATQGLNTSGTANTVTLTNADATTSQKGVLETSTNAEAVAVTATDKALTPSNMPGLLAQPPAIGGTTPAAVTGTTGTFTDVAVENVLMDTSPSSPSTSEGSYYWDATDHCLTVHNDEADTSLQVGQKLIIRVRNESGSTINDGKLVYVTGVESGGESRPLIDLAQADAESTAATIGMATHDIENNSYGYIASFGLVRSLNTASFSAGDPIYLSASSAGGFTSTVPASPNFVKAVGYVIESDAATGSLLIAITPDVSTPAGDSEGLTILGRKGSAGTINAGEVVYVTGYHSGSGAIEVELADSDDASKMPAIGIARESFTNSTNGIVIISGLLVDQDTSSFSVGDELYVDTTAGALTNTRPTAATTEVQKIGIVTRSNVSNGVIEVIGAGRSNDIPNTMSDSIFRIVDNGDVTKVMMFEVSAITTATTRTVTIPDKNVNLSTATTTNEGIVSELATDAEAQAKSDTSRVLTPSNLAALTASDTFEGLVELATDAEAVAVTATNRAVTPANLSAVFAAPPALGSTTPAAVTGTTGTFNDVDVDNVNINGNTISITDTNGNMVQKANGTGSWKVTTPGDSDAIDVDDDGIVTLPLQPSFYAYLSSTANNVSGDGTVYTIINNTEVFDLNADYNTTTGVLTAPVTSKWAFTASVYIIGLLSGHTEGFIRVATSNRTYQVQVNPYAMSTTGFITLVATVSCADMDAADTASATMRVSNSTKVVDVYSDAGATFFSGRMLG
jgi:hypothetical protein